MSRYNCGLGLVSDIPFVAGDEIVQGFIILAEKAIADLTGWTVTAEIWAGGIVQGGIAASVEISNPDPVAGDAHGRIRIVESETAKLAKVGAVFVRLVCINHGRTMHTAGTGLREITGPAPAVSGTDVLDCLLVGVRAADLIQTITYTDDDYAAFAAAA